MYASALRYKHSIEEKAKMLSGSIQTLQRLLFYRHVLCLQWLLKKAMLVLCGSNQLPSYFASNIQLQWNIPLAVTSLSSALILLVDPSMISFSFIDCADSLKIEGSKKKTIIQSHFHSVSLMKHTIWGSIVNHLILWLHIHTQFVGCNQWTHKKIGSKMLHSICTHINH